MISHERNHSREFESFGNKLFSNFFSAREIHASFWEHNEENNQNYQILPNSNYGQEIITNRNNNTYKRSPLSQDENHMAVKSRKSLQEGDELNLNDEPLKYRRYKRNNEVAHHCQRLLNITAYPTVAQLTILIHQISQSTRQKIADQSPSELDSIRSTVLQWFRKRREYLAAKIYNICDERMGEAWLRICKQANEDSEMAKELSYEEIVEEIIKDDEIMSEVFIMARLPITDPVNGLCFVKRKVKDYFMKLCTKS